MSFSRRTLWRPRPKAERRGSGRELGWSWRGRRDLPARRSAAGAAPPRLRLQPPWPRSCCPGPTRRPCARGSARLPAPFLPSSFFRCLVESVSLVFSRAASARDLVAGPRTPPPRVVRARAPWRPRFPRARSARRGGRRRRRDAALRLLAAGVAERAGLHGGLPRRGRAADQPAPRPGPLEGPERRPVGHRRGPLRRSARRRAERVRAGQAPPRAPRRRARDAPAGRRALRPRLLFSIK